jgi:hypothetical protein
MSIVTTGVAHIINVIENILYLIDSQHSLDISTDCDEKDNSYIEITFYLKNGKDDSAQDNVFMKLAFPLINGNSEIRIYSHLTPIQKYLIKGGLILASNPVMPVTHAYARPHTGVD